MLAHIHRHHNEVIFLKCNECAHCIQHPVQATQAFGFLRERGMKFFYPRPSGQNVGHYCTFLEMCNKKQDQLPVADTYLPSFEKELGHCPHCPNYVFLSKNVTFKCSTQRHACLKGNMYMEHLVRGFSAHSKSLQLKYVVKGSATFTY